jgi:hypothetical protein
MRTDLKKKKVLRLIRKSINEMEQDMPSKKDGIFDI